MASRKRASKKKGRHGGLRNPPGGRPRKPQPEPPPPRPPRFLAGTDIDGHVVEDLARAGTDPETIAVFLRIPSAVRSRPDFAAAFADAVAWGRSALEVDLLQQRQALASGQIDGKVSALLAALRNVKGWDRQDKPQGGDRAERQSAVHDADTVLRRLRG